jgi:hypothetical protein
MKNRLIALSMGLTLAVLSGTAAAHDRVNFGISFGVPAPVYVAPQPVYYPAPPVYYAPPAVYYRPQVYYAPAPWGFAVTSRGGWHHGHRR